MGSQVPINDAQIAQLLGSLPAQERLRMHNENMIRDAEAGALARNPAPPASGGGITNFLMGLVNRFSPSTQSLAKPAAPATTDPLQLALEEEKRRQILAGGQ